MGNKNESPKKAQRINHVPPRTPHKQIKEVELAQLEKLHERDIIPFIKNGNLQMAHGLIKYHKLGGRTMNLRAQAETLVLPGNRAETTGDWNPLLIAIGYQKLDIVQYFLNDLKLSLR